MELNDLALWWLTECPNLGWTGWRQVLDRCGGIVSASLFGKSAEYYENSLGLSARVARSLDSHGPLTPAVSASVSGLPIRFISDSSKDFPPKIRLMKEFPPIMNIYGNFEILKRPTAVILCSRGPSRDDLELVKTAVDVALDSGYALAAGHNKPAYQLALLAAKRRAEHSVMVLDRGILATFDDDLRRDPLPAARIWGFGFESERSIVISPFRLHDAWIGANSRIRDALAIALADVIVAVQIRPGGVMESLVREAAERGQKVLADEASMKALGDCGAKPWAGRIDPETGITGTKFTRMS